VEGYYDTTASTRDGRRPHDVRVDGAQVSWSPYTAELSSTGRQFRARLGNEVL
jgi:hypothetical protein